MDHRFARAIKQIRGDRTQDEFADMLNISKAAVSRYESGQRQPGRETIEALLQVAEPEQQRILLEALGVEDVDEFATSLLTSAGVKVVSFNVSPERYLKDVPETP